MLSNPGPCALSYVALAVDSFRLMKLESMNVAIRHSARSTSPSQNIPMLSRRNATAMTKTLNIEIYNVASL